MSASVWDDYEDGLTTLMGGLDRRLMSFEQLTGAKRVVAAVQMGLETIAEVGDFLQRRFPGEYSDAAMPPLRETAASALALQRALTRLSNRAVAAIVDPTVKDTAGLRHAYGALGRQYVEALRGAFARLVDPLPDPHKAAQWKDTFNVFSMAVQRAW